MLWFTFPVALGATLLALSTLKLYQRISKSYRTRKLSKKWSCEPVQEYPSGVFGLKTLQLVIDARRRGQIGPMLSEAHLQYGNTAKFNILGNEVISTLEPENIQAILASQFSSFGLSINRFPQFRPLLGRGIFTSDGARWEHSRRLLRPMFTKTQIPSLEWFDTHFEHFMQALPPDGQAFDVQQLFYRLALDAATGHLFGESVHSLVNPTLNQTGVGETSVSGRDGFAEAFDHAQDVLFKRSFIFSFYWMVNPKAFRDANRVVHRFADYFANKAIEHRNLPHASKEKDGQDYSFLQALAAEIPDKELLRDQVVNVLLASRDDVSSVLSSVFYLLARKGVAWQKLKDEITQTVAQYGNNISPKDIQNLPYLRGVLNETLRLFPPVPINARIAREDTTIPLGGGPDGQSPAFISKDQTILYSVWALHRRQDIWGKDAESFLPERWEDRKQNAWEFVPFNGGPRACLGQQWAIALISHQVFRIVQHLDAVESALEGPEMGMYPPMRQTLTLSHANGVRLRMRRARN